MKLTLAFTAMMAAALTPATPVQADEVRLEGVEVRLTTGEGMNVLEFWPKIEDDLAAEIMNAIEQRPDGTETTIKVRLNEVSFSGSKMLTGEGEFNRMAGWVYVLGKDVAAPPRDQFNIVLDAVTGSAENAPVNAVVLPPATAAFYRALIEAFAARTADAIDAL